MAQSALSRFPIPPTTYAGPMPDVAGDVQRYQQQYANRYPGKPTPALNPQVMQGAATDAFRDTGVTVPDALALAQAQLETQFGTRGPNAKNNPYNIGVQDDRTVNHPTSQEQGVQQYYDLMAQHYLGDKNLQDLLSNFVNDHGKRYASNPQYEDRLKTQIPIVQRRMQ